ncbi:IS605 OrfB family transposase [Clostridium pascui]|nr:IS605 OrfB family transposase [Clostridium pascui]
MNKQGDKYIKTNNIIKLETKINILHKRLNNIHLDYRHKVTTEIVKTKPFRVVMEKLDVTQMLKNKHLSQSVSKQGFYEFKALMKYKCEKNGIKFIEADEWYPSSKTCSKCGYVKSKLSLSERTFICECCGAVIDRDKNASINLSRYEVS